MRIGASRRTDRRAVLSVTLPATRSQPLKRRLDLRGAQASRRPDGHSAGASLVSSTSRRTLSLSRRSTSTGCTPSPVPAANVS